MPSLIFKEEFLKYAKVVDTWPASFPSSPRSSVVPPAKGNFEKKTFNTMGKIVGNIVRKTPNGGVVAKPIANLAKATVSGVGEMSGGGALGKLFGAVSAFGAINKVREMAGAATTTPRRLV